MSWRLWGQAQSAAEKMAPAQQASPSSAGKEDVPAAASSASPLSAPPFAAMSSPKPTLVSPIQAWLEDLHAKYKDNFSGALASYIPELTKADPASFGIVIATADGHTYAVGQSDTKFTIQSISKPFVYGLALEDHGQAHVLTKVGVEPTGEAFNSIVMDEVNNRPFNPMVNAGAIATTALVKGNGAEERWGRIRSMFERYCGHALDVDNDVFQSERATGHRNRAIAFLQLNSNMIAEPVTEHLDLYFQQCSVLVTARDLAMMAATLANDGVNPLTRERAISSTHVKTVLSVMASCGMYDYSGEWVYRVGLPAKSGVGGGIIAVLPGQFGIGVFSPLLDEHGNSFRGIEVCKEISNRFYLHVYDSHIAADNIVRRSYRGGTITSKRQRGDRERRALDHGSHRIVVYELQGGLYFATAEQLMRRISADFADTSYVILDCRRISRADMSSLRLLRDLNRSLAGSGTTLVLAGLSASILEDWNALAEAGDPMTLIYPELDLALEGCETRIIAQYDPAALTTEVKVELHEMDILRSFTPEQVKRLEPHLQRASFKAGDLIIKQGDAADRLFLLASGSAAVNVLLDNGQRSTRMVGFRPGVVFGEFAMFDKGRRVADVVAETDAECYVLTFTEIEKLETSATDIYARLLLALGRLLTDRVRRTTAEVRAMS